MIKECCCPYCGKLLQENAIFCPFCMHSLQDKTVVSAKNYRRRKWLIPVCAIALAVVIVSGICYCLSRPCDHRWEPIQEVIHHDAVGYMDLIITGYEKRSVYYCHYEPDQYIACFSIEGIRKHMQENHSSEPDYAQVMENLESLTIIREEDMPIYDYVPFDQQAYDETIITGYCCSKCGETKPVENPGSS